MSYPEQNSKVSVIIPSYNYGQYLAECLESVIAQTYSNWECIIIDNGSTDNTSDVAKAYVLKDKRIRYYYIEQNGVSFARNLAVKHSEGTYILPLDADDKIHPSYIQKAIKIISENPDVKVVYCDAELFGAFSGKWILPPYSLKNLLIENSIFCTALFRKKDFELTDGFNENMKEGFEDWDFWIRMLGNGGDVYKIPEILFYYRMRQNSRNGVLDGKRQQTLRRQIYENHKPLYDKYFRIPDLIFDNYKLEKELTAVKTSTDTKAGAMLLMPFRFFKKMFNLK